MCSHCVLLWLKTVSVPQVLLCCVMSRLCKYPECAPAVVMLYSQVVTVIRLCVGQFVTWRSLERASLMTHTVDKHVVNCGTVCCRSVFFLSLGSCDWLCIKTTCYYVWSGMFNSYSLTSLCVSVCACCVVCNIQDGAEKLFIAASHHRRRPNRQPTSIISLPATWNL